MKQLCDECRERPAKFFRRRHKYRGLKNNLIIRADKDHTLCIQCNNQRHESEKQRRLNGAKNI